MPKTPVHRQYQREAHLPVESFNLPHGLYTDVTYRQIEYDDQGVSLTFCSDTHDHFLGQLFSEGNLQ